jgi:ActR/RegA family two-component response regulator
MPSWSSQVPATVMPPQAPAGSGAPKVLLVEDDPLDARIMQRALHELGFDTASASTLRQAMSHLLDKRFALVVLDLNLPDSDSGAALLTIESVASRTPVVVVSGATGILEGLRQRLGRCWYLLDKNDLDLGMLAAVTRLAVSNGLTRRLHMAKRIDLRSPPSAHEPTGPTA